MKHETSRASANNTRRRSPTCPRKFPILDKEFCSIIAHPSKDTFSSAPTTTWVRVPPHGRRAGPAPPPGQSRPPALALGSTVRYVARVVREVRVTELVAETAPRPVLGARCRHEAARPRGSAVGPGHRDASRGDETFQPLPGQAIYGAAKTFVLSYTQSLVGELKGSGVSATCLCPGPVDTGFGARAGFTKEEADKKLRGLCDQWSKNFLDDTFWDQNKVKLP